jgi:hypothetical protein
MSHVLHASNLFRVEIGYAKVADRKSDIVSYANVSTYM